MRHTLWGLQFMFNKVKMSTLFENICHTAKTSAPNRAKCAPYCDLFRDYTLHYTGYIPKELEALWKCNLKQLSHQISFGNNILIQSCVSQSSTPLAFFLVSGWTFWGCHFKTQSWHYHLFLMNLLTFGKLQSDVFELTFPVFCCLSSNGFEISNKSV